MLPIGVIIPPHIVGACAPHRTVWSARAETGDQQIPFSAAPEIRTHL